jgi:hypothetical protein
MLNELEKKQKEAIMAHFKICPPLSHVPRGTEEKLEILSQYYINFGKDSHLILPEIGHKY